MFGDRIQAMVTRHFPDCSDTSGLEPVPVTASGDSETDSGPEGAVDGYFGTIWVPPLAPDRDQPHQALFVEDPAQRTLTLTLPEETDVRLVCVNNGLASSETAYRNWGKARDVEIWTDSDPSHERTRLPVLPEGHVQDSVEVADKLGDATKLFLRVDDAYMGMRVGDFDPDHCGTTTERHTLTDGERTQMRDAQGCLVAPAPRAGLSEISVFTDR